MTARHLYVHVPFCRRRCVYCDFSIAVRSPVPARDYLDAVAREWERCARPAAGAGGLSTLYLGGGTPSLLGGAGVAALAGVLGVGPGLDEFTIEANPDDVTPENATAWARSGVNRLSLGVQSCDEAVLRWMHRSHAAAAVPASVARARRAGIRTVSVDVIFALPEQLGRDLDSDLTRFLELEPDHVSLYGLTAEPNTPLGRGAARGEPKSVLPPEARYEDEYLRIHERLAAAGYAFYEVSNAARPGAEAVHNRAYWRLAPYLGIGPSAHSFDGTSRWWNVAPYEAWRRRLAEGASPVAGRELLRPEQRRLEALYLGLRTSDGVELPAPPTGALAAAISGWVAAGWAEVEGVGGPLRLRLTPRGWLRLDELAASL